MCNKKQSVELAQVFNYGEMNGVQIRTQVINDVIWFAARDVSSALGITWTGHTLDAIPKRWKGLVRFTTPGGIQELTSITEAGLYKLSFRCQSEEADRFTDWVAGEVLPSIRKTGKYELKSCSSLQAVSGISPIQYNGTILYNYREVCFATGVKPNSDRKKRTPKCFTKLFGLLFVSMEYARLMEGRAQLRALKAEAESMQLSLFPDDITQG